MKSKGACDAKCDPAVIGGPIVNPILFRARELAESEKKYTAPGETYTPAQPLQQPEQPAPEAPRDNNQ